MRTKSITCWVYNADKQSTIRYIGWQTNSAVYVATLITAYDYTNAPDTMTICSKSFVNLFADFYRGSVKRDMVYLIWE